MDLEKRLLRLENDRAIRDLKARYLRACDEKDPDAVAATLLPDAKIAFDGFPPINNRDEFIQIYREFGCASGIFDIHHAANGIITFDGPERAKGAWSLTFHNINLSQRTVTQFGIEYSDVYVQIDDRWWIAETASKKKSALIQSVSETGELSVVSMDNDANAEFVSQ